MLSSFEQRWEDLHHRLLRLAGKTELDRLCLEKKGRKTKLKKQRKTRQTDYLQRVVHRALFSQYLKLWERLSQQGDIWNAPSTGMLARYLYCPTRQDQPWHSWEWACPENQPARCGVAAWCHPQPYMGQVASSVPACISLVGDLAPKGWCLWKLRFRSTEDKDEDMLSSMHSGIHRWLLLDLWGCLWGFAALFENETLNLRTDPPEFSLFAISRENFAMKAHEKYETYFLCIIMSAWYSSAGFSFIS